MKNLKRITSLVVCIATLMLSFSTFAFTYDEAVPFKLKADKTTIAAGDTFTVTVYADVAATTYENAQMALGNIDYNTSEFTVSTEGVDATNVATVAPPSGENDKSNSIAITYLSAITLDSTALFSFNFTAAADLAPGEYTIELANFLVADNEWNQTAAAFDTLTITVEGGDDDEVKATEGTTSGDITEYTVSNSSKFENKKVLMTSTPATVNANTTFTATYKDGTSKTYTGIWDALAQGAGSISVANVKFGIIVPNTYAASDFTFAIN